VNAAGGVSGSRAEAQVCGGDVVETKYLRIFLGMSLALNTIILTLIYVAVQKVLGWAPEGWLETAGVPSWYPVLILLLFVFSVGVTVAYATAVALTGDKK